MSFPDLEELLPHAGPMCLLDRVLRHEEHETICAVRPADSAVLALPDGRIPSTVALEWMAQCIAVHGGLRAREEGESPQPGLFLGARRATLPAGPFEADRELVVTARWVHGRGLGAHAFACTLRIADNDGHPLLAGGTLNVMIVEDLSALASTGAGLWR